MIVRPLLAAAAVLLAAHGALADFGNYQGHSLDGRSLVVASEQGELRITPIDDAAFEVHYRQRGIRQLPSFALDPAISGDVAGDVTESDDALTFAIDGLTAIIDKAPIKVRFSRKGRPLVAEEHGYFAYDTLRGFRFRLDDDEKVLGGGQRVLGMDRRGRRMPLYNRASYGYELEAEQMYFSVPVILSSNRYAIVFDNSARGWLDIGSTESDVVSFEAVGGRTAYIVVAGDSYPELVGNLTEVTGRQPLPPRWAFGNFASRFGYRDEREARDVVRRFRRFDIPLDAIILDIYWFGPDVRGHMGNLDWDRDAWPNAEEMIGDFATDGVKTIVVTEPFILTTSRRWDDAVAHDALARTPTGEPRRFDFFFGNTGLVDVFDEAAQDWFWQPYEVLFEQGIAGTWGDLGEPEVHPADALHRVSEAGTVATADEIHNAYGHEWARLVYERQVARYPDVRPMILMRSGFAGSQRYGMLPWTGDVARSWDGLKPQVELSLQMGLLGLAYTHSDLGGFAGGDAFDREMYIRWLQYGVFQPVYRPHAQDHIASEPVFHDRETRRIVRDFIRLRYRLLPYIYTLAWENSTTGMPLMRPVFFEDEQDRSLIDEKYSYLWGDAFLVTPVTEAGARSVEVTPPAGAWFDFWDDSRYEGGRNVDIPVTLESMPVLVRAGSFIPMTPDIESTRDYSSARLTLHYYADASVPTAAGLMYEDDGISRTSLKDGAYELLEFAAQQDGDALSIDLERSGGNYAGRPAERSMTLVVHNWSKQPGDIRLGDHAVKLVKRTPRHTAGAYFDARSRRLTVRFDWDHAPTTLQIN